MAAVYSPCATLLTFWSSITYVRHSIAQFVDNLQQAAKVSSKSSVQGFFYRLPPCRWDEKGWYGVHFAKVYRFSIGIQ